MRNNLHELKTSYSNSGFLTTPYEHLLQKDIHETQDEKDVLNASLNASHINTEGYRARAAIAGKP